MEDQNQFHKIVAFTGHRPGHVGVAGFDFANLFDETIAELTGAKKSL